MRIPKILLPVMLLCAGALADNWMLVPQVSVVVPQEIHFSDGSHRTDLTENFLGAPSFGMGLAKTLHSGERWIAMGFLKAMYSYKEGSYRTLYSTGNEEQEKLRLHWIPMQGGIQWQYNLQDLPFLKPTLGLSGGVHWVYQSGQIGGATHSYWVPFAAVSPSLTFFEGQPERDWFGGFSFGLSYARSISPLHSLNSWAFDLSVNILL